MDTPQPMNPWQPPTGNPVNLAAPTTATANPSRTRRTGRAVAFVAAGAIGATAITGLAFAANNTPSPTDSGSNAPAAPTAPGQGDDQGPGMGGPEGGPDGKGGPGMGRHHGGPGMGRPGGGFGGRIQHGEAVVTKKDGTTATVRVQAGAITAVSDTEVTVKSEDGFEQTWPLTADTKISRDRADAKASDLVVGDKVHAIGEVKSGTVTTLRVGALSAAEAAKLDAQRKAHEQQEPQEQQGPGQNPPAPGGSQPSPDAPAPSTTG